MFKAFMTTLFAALPLALMAQTTPVQVMRAEWGADRTWVDVTQRVQAVVDSGRGSFRVDGEALGGRSIARDSEGTAGAHSRDEWPDAVVRVSGSGDR